MYYLGLNSFGSSYTLNVQTHSVWNHVASTLHQSLHIAEEASSGISWYWKALVLPRLSALNSVVVFWSAIPIFPRGAFNLPTVTFKDRGFSGPCNDFHCLNVDVWVALSKEINSISLNWKWTEKRRGFIDFLCLGLAVLVKQSTEVNSKLAFIFPGARAQEDVTEHHGFGRQTRPQHVPRLH